MTATALLRRVYQGLSTGFDTPAVERDGIDERCGLGASAYGEITGESAARLLRWLRLEEHDVLFDLGSGDGRFVLQALCSSAVGRFVGIELSQHRHRIALSARDRLVKCTELRGSLVLQNADMRDADLSTATVAYAGATCFDNAMMTTMARRLDCASDLRCAITTRELPVGGTDLEEIARMRLDMSWAVQVRVHVYAPIHTRPHLPLAGLL